MNVEGSIRITNTNVKSAGFLSLYKTEGEVPLWGMEKVLQAVDPGHLQGYQWLIEDLTPSHITLESAPQYSNQVCMSLCGSAVFHGSFFEMPFDVLIRAEYFIVGSEPTEGINLFAISVRKDIHQLYRKRHHAFLGVSLELPENDPRKKWWTYEDILEQQEVFEQAIEEITLLCNIVKVKCIFKMDPTMDYYVLGEKQYGLNFVSVQQNNNVTCFTEIPMSTLHEGVFFSHPQALSYLSAFAKRIDVSEDGDIISDLAEDAGVEVVTEPNSSKVLIGGFRFSNKDSFDPYAWQTLAPLQSNLQQKIADLNQYTHLEEVLLSIIQLYITDSSAYTDTVVQVAKVLRSSAIKVAHLQHINLAIQLLIQVHSGAQVKVLEQLLEQYLEETKNTFFNEEGEQPSDQKTNGKAFVHKLEEIKHFLIHDSDAPNSHTVASEKLEDLKQYTTVAHLHLVESSLRNCRPLLDFINDLKERFGTSNKQNLLTSAAEMNYSHGNEGKHAKFDKAVLNIDACISQDNAPHSIAKESVFYKYLTDTHLGDAWNYFLLYLLHGPVLPPNPYPRFVSHMRQCSFRMSLCYEDEEQLLKEIAHGNERVERPQHHVYHIPGCDVHGPLSALKLLDHNMFFKLTPLAEMFMQKNYPQRKSLYKVAICSSIVDCTIYSGRLSPYLLELVIHEHCYIRGPDGCAGEAIQIYSEIVHRGFQQLQQKPDVVLNGIQMGRNGSEDRWTVEDVLQRKKAFLQNFETHCYEKETLLIKGFVKYEWRYLPVRKHLMFHYINDDETSFETYFTFAPSSFYMNVFTSADEAAFHFQYGGPPDQSDPCNVSNCRLACHELDKKILVAAEKQDWVHVHRALVTKNLINKGTSHIVEAWMMLQSVAGQLEYVISLGQSIRDLIEYCLRQSPGGLKAKEENRDYLVSAASLASRTIGSVDLDHLRQMTFGYREKVLDVCSSNTTMAPANLAGIVKDKLDTASSMDPTSNHLIFKLDTRTNSVLKEVDQILQALRDATAADIHAVSPAAQAAVASIQAEASLRPMAVRSVDFDHQSTSKKFSNDDKIVNILAEKDIRLAQDF